MIALITGANRGIGRHIAIGLAARGDTVALLGRNADGLDAVAAECRDLGGDAGTFIADVVDPAAVAKAVAAVVNRFGTVDLLVNNAAVIENVEAAFDEVPVDESWRVVEVGVRGPMNAAHAVLPIMLSGTGGRIVNINSGSAYRAGRAHHIYTAYGLAKAALAQFTRRLAVTYRDQGIYVFDVAPGVVQTDMTTSMPVHDDRTDWTPPSAVADLIADIAEGRLDALTGRFFRAGADTASSISKHADEIIEHDARVLRLVPFGSDDPLA